MINLTLLKLKVLIIRMASHKLGGNVVYKYLIYIVFYKERMPTNQ